MVPGTDDDPAIVTCVAALSATPLVFTLMISAVLEVGELLNVRVEMSARLAAEISRTFCAPGMRVTLAFVPGKAGR
jgi:hypothetical protein